MPRGCFPTLRPRGRATCREGCGWGKRGPRHLPSSSVRVDQVLASFSKVLPFGNVRTGSLNLSCKLLEGEAEGGFAPEASAPGTDPYV